MPLSVLPLSSLHQQAFCKLSDQRKDTRGGKILSVITQPTLVVQGTGRTTVLVRAVGVPIAATRVLYCGEPQLALQQPYRR